MNKQNLLKFSLFFLIITMLSMIWVFSKENVEAKSIDFVKSKSLCQPKEQIIWSCTTTKNKIASVCASKILSAEKGYVQYRFGTAGNVELQLPKTKANSQNFFKYSRYTRYMVTMLTLNFENGGFSYVIHDDDNEEEKPPSRSASIDVASGDGKTVSITCKLPTTGSLMTLEDIVPRDENGL